MKKILVLAILLTGMLALFAENPKDEALQSLDNAKKMITQDNWIKAQDEINYALAKISEIQAEQLLTFIPEPVTGFKLDNKDSQGLGQAGAMVGSANAITANGEYSKDDSTIKITISVGGTLGQMGSLMGMANMFGGMGQTTSTGKTIRVNGYTGNQEYDKDEASGTLTIQVGAKITVTVEGDAIATPDILKTFAEKIDLAKLEKAF